MDYWIKVSGQLFSVYSRLPQFHVFQNKLWKKQVYLSKTNIRTSYFDRGEEFRKAFGRLKDLVALFPKAPTLVVTATASKNTREKLITDLGLQEPTVICTNPDRPNIFYSKVERSPATRQQDDLDSILLPIAKGLKEHGRQYPITILYTNSDNMGYTYRYLQTALGDAQYIGEHKAANRLFGVYHKCVSKGLKEVIVSQLASPTSVKRFIAATVALGMGLDAPAIRKVIHFGCPTTIEQFLQESGRAGRDGAPSEAELHYNRCDIRANRPGHSVAMTEFCKSQDVCLRQQLLRQLDFEAPADRIPCHCCSVCKQKCQCVECALSAVQHIGIEWYAALEVVVGLCTCSCLWPLAGHCQMWYLNALVPMYIRSSFRSCGWTK